jgi:hypothetical protein
MVIARPLSTPEQAPPRTGEDAAAVGLASPETGLLEIHGREHRTTEQKAGRADPRAIAQENRQKTPRLECRQRRKSDRLTSLRRMQNPDWRFARVKRAMAIGRLRSYLEEAADLFAVVFRVGVIRRERVGSGHEL